MRNIYSARLLSTVVTLTILISLIALREPAYGQTGINNAGMHKVDSMIMAFMTTYSVPGGNVAITKDGRLIYNRGFGYADQNNTELSQPYTLYRIASNSKAITSIAIMKLIQDGQLSINDTVFGANRILNNSYYLSAITDSRIYNITVKELLEHTGGWDRSIPCDGYSDCDPIEFPLHVASVTGFPNPAGDSAMIKFLLSKTLNYNPGSTYAYSNIGYLMLGKVIEKKSGKKYEAYVQDNILTPLGICDMHLGKNLLADKMEREGEYVSTGTGPSCYNTGTNVPWQYGALNIEAMNAHGEWISTPADYTRLILAVDGFSTVPDILSPAMVTLMTTPSTANPGYAKGWSVNTYNNWWHTGSLPGTTSFMARTAGGYTWAFHFNYRSGATNFSSDLDQLPWNALAQVTSFPTYNLFPPVSNAASLTATKTGTSTVTLSWTNGSGDGRIVYATENSKISTYPAAGAAYTANAAYGSGAALGSNTYVVYMGSGSTVNVTGLDPNKQYVFTAMEYYNNSTTGNNIVFKYGCNPTASINMNGTGVPVIVAQQQTVYPNPIKLGFTLDLNNDRLLIGTNAVITDVAGRVLERFVIRSNEEHVSLSNEATGMYFLRLANGVALRIMKE